MRIILIFLSSLFVLPAFLPLQLLLGSVADLQGKLTALAWFYGILTLSMLSFLCLIVSTKINLKIKFNYQKYLNLFIQNSLIIASIVSTVLLILISHKVFNFRPHLVDVIAQLFQAKIFSGGNFVAELPKYPEFFYTQNILYTKTIMVSQYPPVHALLLSLGEIINQAWLVCPILALGTIYFANRFYRLILNKYEAALATLLLALSPFFLFMGASYMNHVSTIFFISIFVYFCTRYEKDTKREHLIFAGIAIVCAAGCRPLTAVAVCMAYGFILLPVLIKNKVYKTVFLALFAILPVVLFCFYFNYRSTGNALHSGYIELWGPDHGLGFHKSPYGINFGFIDGIANTFINFSMLNEYLFETPIPILIFIPFLFLLGKYNEWDKRLLFLGFSIPCAYVFYWHRDSFLGPRFIFESIIFIIPILVRSLFELSIYLRAKKILIPGLTFELSCSKFIHTFMVLTLLYSVFLGFPQRFSIYASGMESFKFDPRSIIKQAGLHNAIVFVPVSWGGRIIGKLRGMGVPAWLVEQVYRTSDHCTLHNLVEKFYSQNYDYQSIVQELQKLILSKQSVVKINLAGDPSLRLVPTQELKPECISEIEYDRLGFTIYSPYLLDNAVSFSGDIIYATDLRSHNYKLIEQYPGRKKYIIRNNQLQEL